MFLCILLFLHLELQEASVTGLVSVLSFSSFFSLIHVSSSPNCSSINLLCSGSLEWRSKLLIWVTGVLSTWVKSSICFLGIEENFKISPPFIVSKDCVGLIHQIWGFHMLQQTLVFYMNTRFPSFLLLGYGKLLILLKLPLRRGHP